jgi:hypothetical protein
MLYKKERVRAINVVEQQNNETFFFLFSVVSSISKQQQQHGGETKSMLQGIISSIFHISFPVFFLYVLNQIRIYTWNKKGKRKYFPLGKAPQ